MSFSNGRIRNGERWIWSACLKISAILSWEGPPARKTNRGVNIWNSHSIHFILMMTKIYVNYGDLHANELLRDAILSTNVSVKAKKSCDHHASGNFISKQMVNSCIWQERQLQKPTYLRWKKTSQNSILFVFKTVLALGKHEVQLENLNPFSILKLFAQTWNMTARQLINKHCQRHYGPRRWRL